MISQCHESLDNSSTVHRRGVETQPENQAEHKPLEDILDTVDNAISLERVSLKTVLAAFGDRAFGPTLALTGFLLMTPLGAIPGAPFVFCVLILSFAFQIIFGRSRPWLPKQINGIEVTQDNIDATRKYLKPAFRKLDGLTRPRLAWAATEEARFVAAVLSVFLAISLLPLGIVPFAVTIPAAIIALLGMGIMARDGLLLLAGFGLSAIAISIISILLVI